MCSFYFQAKHGLLKGWSCCFNLFHSKLFAYLTRIMCHLIIQNVSCWWFVLVLVANQLSALCITKCCLVVNVSCSTQSSKKWFSFCDTLSHWFGSFCHAQHHIIMIITKIYAAAMLLQCVYKVNIYDSLHILFFTTNF